jgi:hypothetical protein
MGLLVRVAHLHDGVVERDAPGRRLLYDAVLELLVPGEAVDRQRPRPRFQEGDAVFGLLDLKREQKNIQYAFGSVFFFFFLNAMMPSILFYLK